jgi:hypothetical protein
MKLIHLNCLFILASWSINLLGVNAPTHIQQPISLSQAVQQNNLAQVRTLLACGVDPAAPDTYGQTALHYAVDKKEILNLLCASCKSKPDVINALDCYGRTPLDLAAIKAQQNPVCDEIACLIASGAKFSNGGAACAGLAHTMCATLRSGLTCADSKLVQRALSLLHLLINDCSKNITVLNDDQKDVPIVLFINDKLMALQNSIETQKHIKSLFGAFWKKPVLRGAGQAPITVDAYCKKQADEWAQLIHGMKCNPTAWDLAAINEKLPKPQAGKVNVTIVSLPTLLQSVDLAGDLYKNATNDWNQTCAFYSVFHLVNAWRYKHDPVALLSSYSRDNFNLFLGLRTSGADLAQQLSNPYRGKVDAELVMRQKHYPSIIDDLRHAAGLKMGALSDRAWEALNESYAFLSGMNDSTFHYCPTYLSDENKFSCALRHRYGEDQQFNNYFKQALRSPKPFVFPLRLGTPGHASAALVYKFPAAGFGQKPHYFVFFTESNGFLGNCDHGQSAYGETFNFKSAFTSLFANLENCNHYNVCIQGQSNFDTRELCYLMHGIYKKFEAEQGVVFDFKPMSYALCK